jgi:CRP-like cAMP-binding protein
MLLQSADPYLRAAAVWAAGPLADRAPIAAGLTRAKDDEHPLVRETVDELIGPKRAAAGATGLPFHLSTIETMHFLHAVPLFSGLDPEDLHELALYAIDDTIEPPSVLFAEGDPDCDALFVILAGRVSVEHAGAGVLDAAEAAASAVASRGAHRIETLGPGSVVGELSVLDGSRRDSTVRPERGPVRVLRIPGTRFRSGLLRRGRVTEWLLGALAGRIRRLSAPLVRQR